MRASPAHLLFVRCSGAAPPALEQTIDAHFMATIEKLRPIIAPGRSGDSASHTSAVNTLLAALAADLDVAFAARRGGQKRRGLSPAALLLWTLLLLLAGWGGWSAYAAYQTARVRGVAEGIIAEEGALRGYPVHVAVDDRGGRVALVGLVPRPADAVHVTRRIREALPSSQVTDQTSSLPGGLAEARAQIGELTAQVSELGAGLATLTAELKRSREDAARREAQLAQSAAESKARLAALQADLARLSQPTPDQRLAEWVRTHAIFFVKDATYRDDAAAAAALDQLAGLLKETKAFVRVVGHTDEKGGQTHNSPLSLARATKVVGELERRGIPADRLIAVGRNDVDNLSPTIGDASPNRRVEFEIGFEDETAE
jgi:outer membrane protein OmpA-like peptidoglycan-associated protein